MIYKKIEVKYEWFVYTLIVSTATDYRQSMFCIYVIFSQNDYVECILQNNI